MSAAKQSRHAAMVLLLCQAIEYAIAAGLVMTATHLTSLGRTVLLVAACAVAVLAALTGGPLGIAKLLRLSAHRQMLVVLPVGFLVAAVLAFRPTGIVPAGALAIVAVALFRVRGMTGTKVTTAEAADERRAGVPDDTIRRAGNAVGRGLRAGEEQLHRGAYGFGRVIGRWRR